MTRDIEVQVTTIQAFSVDLDEFKSVYGYEPTKNQILDFCVGNRGMEREKIGAMWSGTPQVIDTWIDNIPPKVVAPKMKRGRGSY